MTTSPERRGN